MSNNKIIVGRETNNLLKSLNLSDNSYAKTLDESRTIISKSLLDLRKETDKKTGIAIGYIQSGKTLSFTTVSCLASDNNFSLIIIIAGTSTNLFSQTANRLKKDLRIESRQDRKWAVFENPKPSTPEEESIESSLRTWQGNGKVTGECKTTLIIIMKNHRNIGNLAHLLSRLDSDLKNISTLIIDDEADQAGLNTNASQDTEDLSTTYEKILDLRNCMPYHTYLQYTATPQALLLINIFDHLSPEFAQFLTPGENYIGGKELFSSSEKIIRINDDETPIRNQNISSPPRSLLKALMIFFTSVAIAYCRQETDKENRSMMIHPSRLTSIHSNYWGLVKSVTEHWSDLLSQSSHDQDYQDLITDFKKEGYDELKKTVENLPPFSEVEKEIKRSIEQTAITKLNSSSGKTQQISWYNNYSHILIGGQAMDRGYTVEGLTVTYMPRTLGAGNADTIQQRARFYGYKRDYLEYCRVFIENGSLDALRNYVEHEESIRKSLTNHIKENKELKDWKRVFFLDKTLKPTRRNILEAECARYVYNEKWFQQKKPTINSADKNLSIINSLIEEFDFKEDTGHKERTEPQKHLYSYIRLERIYQSIIDYRVSTIESNFYAGALLQIESFLDKNPEEICVIYLMSSFNSRDRSINQKGQISQLFQGHAVNQKEVYPGDREIKNNDQLTIQIHNLNIIYDGKTIAQKVPTLAIWFPKKYAKAWVSQQQ